MLAEASRTCRATSEGLMQVMEREHAVAVVGCAEFHGRRIPKEAVGRAPNAPRRLRSLPSHRTRASR